MNISKLESVNPTVELQSPEPRINLEQLIFPTNIRITLSGATQNRYDQIQPFYIVNRPVTFVHTGELLEMRIHPANGSEIVLLDTISSDMVKREEREVREVREVIVRYHGTSPQIGDTVCTFILEKTAEETFRITEIKDLESKGSVVYSREYDTNRDCIVTLGENKPALN